MHISKLSLKLIQNGFLQITPRGRVATEIAYKYFGRNKYKLNDEYSEKSSLFDEM